jgi:hypothetical protein
VTYRDDEETRKAHLAALEARIDELENENAQLLLGERPVETLFGQKLTLVAEEEQRGVVSKPALRRFLGQTERVVNEHGKHSVGDEVAVWRSDSRDLDVTVRRGAKATTLRVSERIGLVTGAMVGGVLGGAGGVAMLALVFSLRMGAPPVAMLAIPVWLLLLYGVARYVMWRHVRGRQRKLDEYARTLAARLPALDDDADEEAPS